MSEKVHEIRQVAAPSDYVRQLYSWASTYARLGWRMIPIHRALAEGLCTCPRGADCGSPGKHPILRSWRTIATTDVGTVSAWIDKYRDRMNLAIAPDKGTIVLDVDGSDGHSELASLQVDYGMLPHAPTQVTGSGGAHILLRSTQELKNAVKFRPGLDCKTTGGYIVVAPSMHVTGRQYEWSVPPCVPDALPDAPVWLTELLHGRSPPIDVESWLGRQPGAVSGENGSGRTFAVVCRVIESRPDIDLQGFMELIAAWNATCSPPWSDSELAHKFADARKKVTLAAQDALVVVGVSKSGPFLRPQDYSEILRTDPRYAGTIRWCTVRDRPIYRGEPMDSVGMTGLRADISTRYGVNTLSKSDLEDACMREAHMNPLDPLRDWTGTLRWDGVDRMPTLAKDVLGIVSDTGVTYARKTLIGAMARVLTPGCRLDTCWILIGAQGIQKSTFVRTLVDVVKLPIDALYRADRLTLDSKDAYQTIWTWALEIAEIEDFFRHDQAMIKNFLTKTEDTYRPPYAREYEAVSRKRRCFFVGTTNEDEILRDTTGNRRFWVSVCDTSRIDLQWVVEHRQQLWAQALHELRAGHQYHLTEDEDRMRESESDPHMVNSVLYEATIEYIDRNTPPTISHVELCEALLIRPEQVKAYMRGDMAAALKDAGYVRRRVGNTQTGKRWVWVRD